MRVTPLHVQRRLRVLIDHYGSFSELEKASKYDMDGRMIISTPPQFKELFETAPYQPPKRTFWGRLLGF